MIVLDFLFAAKQLLLNMQNLCSASHIIWSLLLKIVKIAEPINAVYSFCWIIMCFRERFKRKKKTVLRQPFLVAPTIWFEQMTDRLTADCSTAELSRNDFGGRYRNWTDIKGFAVLCMSHSANRPVRTEVPNSFNKNHIYRFFFKRQHFFSFFFIFFISVENYCFLIANFSCYII